MKRFVYIGIVISLIFMPTIAFAEINIQNGGIPGELATHVLPFKYKNIAGTCFVVDVDNRQYIITARHICSNIKDEDMVQLYINKVWYAITIKPIFPVNNEVDIVALATNRLIMPKMEFNISSENLMLGQDIYFLGFPFLDLKFSTTPSDNKFALFPFIKKGIFSAAEGRNILYLDGHNNPGFSGGPVIFSNHFKHHLQVAGVISGYRNNDNPILVKEIENPSTSQEEQGKQKKIVPYVSENTGIIVAYDIGPMIEAIRSNPIGFPLSQ
jgi:prepilin-type processing-associated H-X9-DG protein